MFVTQVCIPTQERGNEEKFPEFTLTGFLLLFCVRLCTPQGGIELNVSVAKKSSSPAGRLLS